MRAVDKAGELCFTGLRIVCSNVQQLDGEVPSGMYRNRSKSHPEVDGSSGRCRLEVAWPVCDVLVVYSVFQWDTDLNSLWGFDSVQCVPVGHPLDQAGWDQLALSGSQSARLIYF